MMNKRRLLIYGLIFLALILSVLWKRKQVDAQRQEKIISAFSEWDKFGKPVVVQKVRRKDVPVYTKVTAWQIAPDTFEGQVSKSVKDQLKIGQDMHFKVDGSNFTGVISQIAQEISLDTGMFPVRVKFRDTFDIPGWLVAYAHINTFQNVISLPNDIIEKENDDFFVWKIENNAAVRQPVMIRQRDGYGAVIEKGVQEGDTIVVRGYTQLTDGVKVNILKEVYEETNND